eukprot:5689385-Pleurochrysis_carterae.AAC.1
MANCNGATKTPPTVGTCAPLRCAVCATRVVLGVGKACMAAAEAGVLQLSIPGVLASVGCSGLA